MAKPWREVESSPTFQSLGPHEQLAAKQEYFNTVVAPQVAPVDVQTAYEEFFSSKSQPQEAKSAPYELAGPISRGVDAVQKGFDIGNTPLSGMVQTGGDVPHVVAKIASGLLENAPENVMKRPFLTSMAGLPGVQAGSGVVPEETNAIHQRLFPQPTSEGGAQAGGDLGTIANVVGIAPAIESLQSILSPKPSPQKLWNKAEKLTTEILQPSKQELAGYLEKGRQMPAIEQAAKVISKSKDYSELRSNIDGVIKKTFDRRNELIGSNNKPIGTNYLDELENLIKKEASKGQTRSEELLEMKKVLDAEKKFLGVQSQDFITLEKKSPTNQIDLVQAQKRKEYLQDLTERLLEKRDGGETIIREPARYRALDALRVGLKKAIHSTDKEIGDIDETYGGLLRAKELIAGQEALTKKQIPMSTMEKIIRAIKNPSELVTEAAVSREKQLSKTTGNIQMLMESYKNATRR